MLSKGLARFQASMLTRKAASVLRGSRDLASQRLARKAMAGFATRPAPEDSAEAGLKAHSSSSVASSRRVDRGARDSAAPAEVRPNRKPLVAPIIGSSQPVGMTPERRAMLDKLTKARDAVLDRWADAGTLGFTQQEVDINVYLRKNLKYLFGETGFNPPVPARNPVSVTMHNPRFSAALWAVNTEAYRRRGTLSRSQKEVVALGVSLSNECPHCAYIHTAMGGAAGSDVAFEEVQRFYQTRDPEASFPSSSNSEPLNRELASWSIHHRSLKRRKPLPCTRKQVPEILGTTLHFEILNRVVDAFVSKAEAGPMFPLPVRAMMWFQSMSPLVQRLMSSMMSWMMRGEDAKVPAGQVLREINQVTPIVGGLDGNIEEAPPRLPQELSWAAGDKSIERSVAFLAAESEAMAKTFISEHIRTYVKHSVARWEGGKAPRGPRHAWLNPVVDGSKLTDKGQVAMLRLMVVIVVSSDQCDDDLLSECQEFHGIRGTHAAVMWAAFLAAQRSCQLAVATS